MFCNHINEVYLQCQSKAVFLKVVRTATQGALRKCKGVVGGYVLNGGVYYCIIYSNIFIRGRWKIKQCKTAWDLNSNQRMNEHHQLDRLVSESACERKDPGSNPAADMVDAARNTAWDLDPGDVLVHLRAGGPQYRPLRRHHAPHELLRQL
ncbi:hypothetical protein FHG87_020584 [Trinorchestia longiramus]|nr:hypothetical protein FHG87_020584 [Trinorchestia longiramus]